MEFVFYKLKLYFSKHVLVLFVFSLFSVLFVTFVTTKTETSAIQTSSPISTVPEIIPTTTILPTTTLPPVTTTTINLSGVNWEGLRQMEIDSMRQKYGKCGEYHDLAISVGWPEEEWSHLQQVMWRESRCTTDSWNGHDAGLTQINQIHSEWLSQMGWSHPQDMFDPEKNLTFAFRLWETSGWKPWRFSGTTWGD